MLAPLIAPKKVPINPLASLGSLISDGYKSLTMYPFLVLFPVVVLAMLMLSFNLMADGLRDAFDPKMKEM